MKNGHIRFSCTSRSRLDYLRALITCFLLFSFGICVLTLSSSAYATTYTGTVEWCNNGSGFSSAESCLSAGSCTSPGNSVEYTGPWSARQYYPGCGSWRYADAHCVRPNGTYQGLSPGDTCGGEESHCASDKVNDSIDGFELGPSSTLSAGKASPDVLNHCKDGCVVVPAAYKGNEWFSYVKNGVQNTIIFGKSRQTGAVCSGEQPTDNAVPEDTCASGQVKGEFNGKTVCLEGGKPVNTMNGNPTQDNKTTETTVSSNPDGSTTSTSTTTNPDGSTSTTTTTTHPDGSSESTTETSGEPLEESDFCKENPNLSICQDSSASGSCSGAAANVECDGDAIQCAIFREQVKRNCEMWNENDESHLYDDVKAGNDTGTQNNPSKESNRDEQSIGSLDMSKHFGAACMPDMTQTIWGKSITIPFSNVCPYLEIMGNIVIMAALIVGAKIVGGA